MQRGQRGTELRRYILVCHEARQRCFVFRGLLTAQDCLLDHFGADFCTLTRLAARTWSLQESVHATRCLSDTPERSEEMEVVPGSSESVNGCCFVVLPLFYIVLSFLSAP